MAEIVNLRRARKNKAHSEKTAKAETNRIKHSVSKRERALAVARSKKERSEVERHKLDS